MGLLQTVLIKRAYGKTHCCAKINKNTLDMVLYASHNNTVWFIIRFVLHLPNNTDQVWTKSNMQQHS